jgi:transposase InsO family protein
MCHVLQVSRSGYYDWLGRPSSDRQQRQERLVKKIEQVHQQSRQIYGSPRVHHELADQGVACCQNTVARLMKEHGIRARSARRFKLRTTDSTHGRPVAANRLEQVFEQASPNRVWTTDITYLPTGQGWLYLAVVMDLCSRRIVGWSMAEHMESGLVIDALEMALAGRGACPGLVVHSDQGVQYASDAYQKVLSQNQLVCSMSRRGNCYDNAVTESFFGTFKTEWAYHEQYQTHVQARASVFEYIEVFYNRQRRHSSLGYLSPEAFEAKMN